MKMEETKTTLNYKLSYVNSFSNSTRKNVEELRKTFCRESGIYIYIYIYIVFSPCEIADLFSSKDCYQDVWIPLYYTGWFF